MGNIVALFTSLHGRIARKSFWIGAVALIFLFFVASLAVTVVILRRDPFTGAFEPTLGDMRRHGIIYLVVILIILYPSLAVLAKRLQDLNWPGWTRSCSSFLRSHSSWPPSSAWLEPRCSLAISDAGPAFWNTPFRS